MRARTPISLAILVSASLFVSCATPDPVITAKVKAKLLADDAVRPYQIEVGTESGVVTLTGNIDSPEAKERALELARDTTGVLKVLDMIAVRTAAGSGDAPDPGRTVGEHVDDAAITVQVKARLLEDPAVKGLRIDVDTRSGVVFLTGSVRSEAEKEKAIQLAWDTSGVKDVRANLTISSS